MRRGMAQSQHFKGGAHLSHLLDFIHAETGDPNASARLADDKPLRFQTPERLAYRHMACAELLGNMILAQPGPRFERTGDDAIGKRLADPHRDCVVFSCCH